MKAFAVSIFSLALLCTTAGQTTERAAGQGVSTRVDPVARYFEITYPVPEDAPGEIEVGCTWSPPGVGQWRKASVFPLISETAWHMLDKSQWGCWRETGCLTERRAAGLTRMVIFNPYPEAQIDGKVDVDFKIELKTADKVLATHQVRLQADNSDVLYIEDWSKVMQADQVVTGRTTEPAERKWSWQTDCEAGTASFGNRLYGQSPAADGLKDLTYPLNLKGNYAIYVMSGGQVLVRLTGDECADVMGGLLPGKERYWKHAAMDRQHLVVIQDHGYTGWLPTTIDYVKLVPLTADQAGELEAPYRGKHDKLVANYWEPYSWAFYFGCREPQDHKKPLLMYQKGKVDILDTQLGRFGMKSVYESRIIDQLIYDTYGDPEGAVDRPITTNVGMMQQYTNALEAELRYSRELGLTLFAEFGISNCYPKTNLQGDISKEHPEWRKGNTLRFEIPEVRQFALKCFEECLEIGADHLGIDFCRYAKAIDTPETGNTFMRELNKLTSQWEREHGKNISILTRIPVIEFKEGWRFDFATWVKNGWVDYLVPSDEAERFYNFDVTPYLAAAKGTSCKVLPNVGYDQRAIGLALWRTRQLYQQGVDGVYFYNGWIPWSAEAVRNLPLFGSTEMIEKWWQRDTQNRGRYSKAIYIIPTTTVRHGYWKQNRVRVWLDGVEWGKVKIYLDDKLINSYDGPPYTMGTEGHESDGLITPGEHKVKVQARDGKGWLEQTLILPKQPD
jgi:hypothetical protein